MMQNFEYVNYENLQPHDAKVARWYERRLWASDQMRHDSFGVILYSWKQMEKQDEQAAANKAEQRNAKAFFSIIV